MQQQYLVCNLPKKLGGLSVNELKDLLHESGIVRSKSNNFLKTKKDMCLALTLKGSDAFLDSLRSSIDEFNPSLRDFAKIASTHAKISKQTADKLHKDKNKVRDLHHNLLMENYHFPNRSDDLQMAGLQNRYESERNELQAMYDRLERKESEIRSMQNDLETQKRNFSHPTDESGLAAIKMDVMQLKMQEKYLLNAIDEIRLHLNRLKAEDKVNPGQSAEVQSRILQLLEMKKELEQSAHVNSGKLEAVKIGMSPSEHAEFAKLEESANNLSGSNSLEEDAEKIHKEVEEKQQDIEQLRVNLAAVRTRLQQYVEIFPRVEDAIAFAVTSTDLKEKAVRLQNIIRAADGISKRVHDKMEKLSDSSLKTQQQDPDDVVSLLQNVDVILDRYDEVNSDVKKVDQTLEKAQMELKDLRETFVSLAQRVDKNVDAANLDDHELANILKDFIINRNYLKTAITDLQHEHGIAHSRTASVKSKLANISETLGKLENNQALVGGGDASEHENGEDEDILNVLSKIETRVRKIAEKQADDRQTYLNTLNKYKASLAKQERELKEHLSQALDKRTEDIRAEVESIEREIQNNNETLREFVKELQNSTADDKKKLTALSKKAFELMEEQSVLFHGLKVKFNAIDFAGTLKTFAYIQEEPLRHDESLFDNAAKRYDEELESIKTLKAELKDALDEHSRLNSELSAVDFEIKKAEVRADHDRLLEELSQKRRNIEVEISENEKELKEYEAEVIAHEQNIGQINSEIDDDVFSALEDAYQAQMASKSERLERVNQELEEISEDDSEESLEAHKHTLHRDATLKLQDIIQKLKEEISNIRTESGELDHLKAHKVNLLQREKELTQKYLGTLEGRDSDLASLADRSRQIHDQHLEGLDSGLSGEARDVAYNAKISQMMELEQQTKEKYESLQNECRERLSTLDQEKLALLQEVRNVQQQAAEADRIKKDEVEAIQKELVDVNEKLSSTQQLYEQWRSKAYSVFQQFQDTKKQLDDLTIKTDPGRVEEMEERLAKVEMENNRNMMLKDANDHLRDQVKDLLKTQTDLQAEVLESQVQTDKIAVLEGTLLMQRKDLTRGRIEFERKSAEKAHLDRQLEDIGSTIKDLMGKKLYKFDDPRSIAKEPVEAIRDIADDYDFFRNAYQDTAKGLRDNIVELVKTLNQGNTMIDYDTIQSRVDALKYLPENQQKERIKQTREMIADDYESLVRKGKEEARLLAKTYEAETDWKQVETKINHLLAPEGSIEHSRESLKLINDFFRLTKSSMRKLEEEKQAVDVKILHDQMIAYFEAAQGLDIAARSNEVQDFLDKARQLYETSKKINFDTLESAMYRMDKTHSRTLQSFLDVFKSRNDELLLELVRKFERMPTQENSSQRFSRVEDFIGQKKDGMKAPNRLTELNPNIKSRLELMSQVFPKIELLLFKIPDAPIDEQIYFDASRFASSASTRSSATQLSASHTTIDVGKHLYKTFYDDLITKDPKWLEKTTEGTKAFDEDLFKAMLDLKRFNVVQNDQYPGTDCTTINKDEIREAYEKYGKPSTEIYIGFEVFEKKKEDNLVKYFQEVQKFVDDMNKTKNKKFGGDVLSDVQNIKHHIDLKREVLKTALTNKENKLNTMEKRGGRIVDTNSIVPYDIRKLNAVLTRVNDLVAANLKDLQKAKAAGFENAQYETKLRKLENDLLEKENLLSQFDGITKQSIERALLLEKELVKQNELFESFCLFLMGYRKDLQLFDSSKNVFGFKKKGKAIFKELDWHAELELPKDELIFRGFTHVQNIKQLLRKQLKNLNYKHFEELLESLISCHSYLQNSDSFHEEDMILQEIISLRSTLDKLKNDETEDKMTLEAHLEDLKHLNENWKLEISSKEQKALANSRNMKSLLKNIGKTDLTVLNLRSLRLLLLDSIKGKVTGLLNVIVTDLEDALTKNDPIKIESGVIALRNIRKSMTISGVDNQKSMLWLALTLVDWAELMDSKKLFLSPNSNRNIETIANELNEQKNGFKEMQDNCNVFIENYPDEQDQVVGKAVDVLMIIKEVLGVLSVVIPDVRVGELTRQMSSKMKSILPRMFDGTLKSRFSLALKALVEEIVRVMRSPSYAGGGITNAAKHFIDQTDNLYKSVVKNTLLPTNVVDASERTEAASPQTYDGFMTTVMSTTGRENIEAMLEKLQRLTREVTDSADENELQLSTLYKVASKLLQERLDCQERTDKLSENLGQQLYEAEKSFKQEVKDCNDRIHSANQKALKAEDEQISRGSTTAKGDGIAYGYLITRPAIDSLNDIFTGETSLRKNSTPPPYDNIPQGSTVTQASEKMIPRGEIPGAREDPTREQERIEADSGQMEPTVPGPDITRNSDITRNESSDTIVQPQTPDFDPLKDTETGASLSTPSDEQRLPIEDLEDPWSGFEVQRGTDQTHVDDSAAQHSNPPMLEQAPRMENEWATETPPNSESMLPDPLLQESPANPASTVRDVVPVVHKNDDDGTRDNTAAETDKNLPRLDNTNAEGRPTFLDSSADSNLEGIDPWTDGDATRQPRVIDYNVAPTTYLESTKPDTPVSKTISEFTPGMSSSTISELAPEIPSTAPELASTTAPELIPEMSPTAASKLTPEMSSTTAPELTPEMSSTSAWDSLATERANQKQVPDSERFRPRQKMTTSGDAVFVPPSVPEMQNAFTNLSRSGYDEMQDWNNDVITGGGDMGRDSLNRVMGHLLLLYIHYSRFIRKPQILRLISTVDAPGGSFVAALRASGVDEADSIYIDLLRLIFVDVTDLVLPEEIKNNEIGDRLLAFTKANTITYRMQLQALDKGASERRVIRTDLFFRFCLDFLRSFDSDKLIASLLRVDSSINQSATRFTTLDLFLIQVLYQSDVKQKMVMSSNTIADQEFMRNMNLKHTHAGTSAVLTYVKVRCDKNEIWNERYRLGVLRNEAAKMELLVEFNTHVFPYYSHDKENALRGFQSISDEARRLLPVGSKNNWAVADNSPYQYHMLFGPFTKVFGPDTPVQEIAKECEGITTTITSGKSVLMLGYGASGSGKTSTLVCQSGKGACREPGILPNILADQSITSRYRDVELSICESFAGPSSPDGEVHWKTQNMHFEFDGRGFNFKSMSNTSDQYTPLPEHSERTDDPGRWKLSIDEKTRIDTVIHHSIEVDRRSRGTTNNPNSSRSHVLVFVHFVDGPYLILGDFAGVENEFVCDDINTLLAIYNAQKCDDIGNCARVYNPSIATADLAQFQRGQCGAGIDVAPAANSKNENFVLHGEDDKVPDAFEETNMVTNVLSSRGTQGSLFLQLGMQSPKKIQSVPSATARNLLTELRKISNWADEKSFVEKMLFHGRSESATYLELAKTDQTSVAKLLDGLDRKRIDFTISLIAAASASKDTSIWGAKVLAAIDAFVGSSPERKQAKPEESARRELKTLLQGRRECLLDIFGFDGNSFEKAIRDLPYTELANQLQSLGKRFAKLFDVIKVSAVKPRIKKEEDELKKSLWDRILQVEQFLTAVVVAQVGAFDSSFQMVKRMIVICKCRTYEGRYINNSLEQVRNIVKDVIQRQQQEKGKLRTTPAFADACLPIYCNPFKEDCLESEDVQNKFSKEISLGRSLLNTISAKIGENEFQSMKIAVFTVFLMNRTVNNDPPVPFIYAEDLRSEYIRLRNRDSTKELAEEIELYLSGSTKTAVLKEIDRYESGLTSEIKPEIVNDLRIQISNQRARLGENIANGLESQLSNASAYSLNTIKNLLRSIDGINAVHPVGTLQVTDAIAKFNMSDLYCSFSQNSSPFVAQLREKLEGNNCFVNLMSKNRLTLSPPGDPAEVRSKHVGGMMFDPKTVDEFLHQWLVTTGSAFTDYLYRLSDRVEKNGGGRPHHRRSTKGRPSARNMNKRRSSKRNNPKRKSSRNRSSIKMPARLTRKFL